MKIKLLVHTLDLTIRRLPLLLNDFVDVRIRSQVDEIVLAEVRDWLNLAWMLFHRDYFEYRCICRIFWWICVFWTFRVHLLIRIFNQITLFCQVEIFIFWIDDFLLSLRLSLLCTLWLLWKDFIIWFLEVVKLLLWLSFWVIKEVV